MSRSWGGIAIETAAEEMPITLKLEKFDYRAIS
jgi:hypothetical protein